MRLDMLLARFDLVEASRPSLDYCRSAGIEWSAAVAACGGLFLVEAKRSGRYFDPAPGGELMAWIDALGEDAETPIDCVAWPIEQPDVVLTLGGAAAALGMSMAVNPSTYALNGCLKLHRTPLQWLQSGCDGAVVVDSHLGARWLLDLNAPRIATQDRQHARELVAAMDALVGRERFIVPSGAREAA